MVQLAQDRNIILYIPSLQLFWILTRHSQQHMKKLNFYQLIVFILFWCVVMTSFTNCSQVVIVISDLQFLSNITFVYFCFSAPISVKSRGKNCQAMSLHIFQKASGDLKQNGTQEKNLLRPSFSWPLILCDPFCSINHPLIGSNFLTANQKLLFGC